MEPKAATGPLVAVPDSLLVIAGWGLLPRLVLEGARAAGVRRLCVLGFRGSCPRSLRPLCDRFERIPLGSLALFLERARAAECPHVVLAGQIHPMSLLHARFDASAKAELAKMPVRNAHTAFGRIVELLAESGMETLPASLFLAGHLPEAGLLTQHAPDERVARDIRYGLSIARDVGDADIGQTVVVKEGVVMAVEAIEGILASDPDRVVVVDEAYIDFGGVSCIPLIKKYPNLLVTRTFSKSRSMAGARLGFAVGCEALIGDLNTLRYSTNPYNVNSLTLALGLGTVLEESYTQRNCAEIIRVRELTAERLKALGFRLTDSKANFLFARSDRIPGGELYRRLKERGVLVRHFDKPRIDDYNRITIGTEAQMDALLEAIKAILEERT